MKKEPKVIIVGQGQIGKTTLTEALSKDIDAVLIDESNNPNYDVEVNGVKYIKRDRKPMNKDLSKILMMAQMIGVGLPSMNSPLDGLDINIVSEYKLIQQKKSNLSAKQRYAVKAKFENLFEKI